MTININTINISGEVIVSIAVIITLLVIIYFYKNNTKSISK
ncbi:MAG: hypothetical protein ACI9TV_001069 [Sulfurimonas sp.]|jgi:hypothetical protein